MGFQIIHHDEPLVVDTIVAVLFGEAGSGKSSLSFTAESPLLMDFDRGLQRVVGRKASARFTNWAEALEFIESDTIKKEGIKTLIVDTAGTMLDDYMAAHILKMDVKGVDNGAGGLGLRGYGVMKDVFAKFYIKCKEHGVDIIFICHSKKEDDGDTKRFFPQLTGGSYDILISKADLVGYMEMQGEKITLDFNPTSRHTGKNCAGFKKMELPHFESKEYSTFMGDLIQRTKDHMRKQNQAQVKAIEIVEDYKLKIASAETIPTLEELLPGIEQLSPMYKAQVLSAYSRHYAEMWSIENIDVANTKTPEAFKALGEKIAALPKMVVSEMYEPFRKLMEAAGISYDKNTKEYSVKAKEPSKEPAPGQQATASAEPEKAAAKKGKEKKENPPAPPAEPAAKVTRDEDWFIQRIGKKVLQKAPNKAAEEVTIQDENQCYHFCAVMQKYKNVQYFDMTENPDAAKSTAPQETATA